MSRYSNLDCKVYVGDLPKDATDREIERAFSGYGSIRSVWVARNPAGFAFVEYEDSRDAEDAVRALDGSNICGVRARVEFATGKTKPKSWEMPRPRSDYRSDYRNDYRNDFRRGRNDGGSRRAFNPDDKCYECGERGHYAYDCEIRLRKQRRTRRSRSRSRTRRSRSYSRRYSRSKSRSRSRSKDSKSRSRSRSRSGSPRESRSRDRSDSRN